MINKKNDSGATGIVLFAKPRGKTSFQSLYTIKKALNTSKVGHTGTLDSFADGLLVVLAGKMTSLVSHITDFDKTYEAVIKFGSETDTLDPTGEVTRTANLPRDIDFFMSLAKFSGEIEQVPPAYSALHIDGKRASDLARSGKVAEIPARKVSVYSLDVVEILTSPTAEVGANGEISGCSGGSCGVGEACKTCSLKNKYISFAHIKVRVSKGTYIRSLARDIGEACGSAAHLVALRRTEVGPFRLVDACGSTFLKKFDIREAAGIDSSVLGSVPDASDESLEKSLQDEVAARIFPLTPEVAAHCGMGTAVLKKSSEFDFSHGKPLSEKMFDTLPQTKQIAVFDTENNCRGIISQSQTQKGTKLSYEKVFGNF